MRIRRAGGLILCVGALAAAAVFAGTQHQDSRPTHTVVISAKPASNKKSTLRPQDPSAPCPTGSYPASPTDKTSYEVPFQASILNGYLNAGYHEDFPTLTPGSAFGPWAFHLTNLTGTVCGLLQIPSLQLTVQGVNVSINNYGQINPINPTTDQPAPVNGPTSLGPGATATYSFDGLADPDNLIATGLPGAGTDGVVITMDSLAPDTVGIANYAVNYPTPAPTPITVDSLTIDNKDAATAPGAAIKQGNTPVSGSITIQSNDALSNVTGTEPDGFITAATTSSTSCPPQGAAFCATYNFTFLPSANGEGAIPLHFQGQLTPNGPTVSALAVAYYSDGRQGLLMSNIAISAAGTEAPPVCQQGEIPTCQSATLFNGTFQLTNETSGRLTGITGVTSQAASLYIMGGSPTFIAPTSLSGFNLSVVSSDLTTAVTGASSSGLSAGATANATGTFFAADPLLTCEAPIQNAALTTGTSTVQPAGRGSSSVWTMQGKPIQAPLLGATGTLIGNDFPVTILNTTGCPSAYQNLFNDVIGGVNSEGVYYNGPVFAPTGSGPPGEVQLVLPVEVTSVGSGQTAGLPCASPAPLSSPTTAVPCPNNG